MAEPVDFLAPFHGYLGKVLDSLWKDRWLIIAVTLVLAAIGAALGKTTNKTTSTAQLALTPLPISDSDVKEDPLVSMLAEPLDVTSVSMLCQSDEVIRATMDALNASGKLSRPIKWISALKKSLRHKVTIAKETPYDLSYTPILELTAKASTPSDAKEIVNAWAENVEQKAKEFQDAIQDPAEKAIAERVTELEAQLEEAEEESEAFWRENNPEYYTLRIAETVRFISMYEDMRAQTQADAAMEKARADALAQAQEGEAPTVPLRWTPSRQVAQALGAKVGLQQPSPEGATPSGQASQAPEAPTGGLMLEWVNDAYSEIQTELALARSEAAGKEARLKQIDAEVEAFEKEFEELEARYARVKTEQSRVERNLQRVEQAHDDIALKGEFARVAQKLDNPQLHVISLGTEWDMPRFRKSILFGGVLGVNGFIAAAFLSVVYRVLLRPALKNKA